MNRMRTSLRARLGWLPVLGFACASPVDLGPFDEPTLPLREVENAEQAFCSDGQRLRATGRIGTDWEGGLFQPSGTAAGFVVKGETERFFRIARGQVQETCYFVDVEGRCEFEPDWIPSNYFVIERVIHARSLSGPPNECLPVLDDVEPR